MSEPFNIAAAAWYVDPQEFTIRPVEYCNIGSRMCAIAYPMADGGWSGRTAVKRQYVFDGPAQAMTKLQEMVIQAEKNEMTREQMYDAL